MTPPPSDAVQKEQFRLFLDMQRQRDEALATVDALRAMLAAERAQTIDDVSALDGRNAVLSEQLTAARARIVELEGALGKAGQCRYCGGVGTKQERYGYGNNPCGACRGTGLNSDARKALAPAAEPESLRAKGG